MPDTDLGAAGRHPDPDAADVPRPNPASWPPGWRAAFESPAMGTFRDALRLGDRSLRESVLDDLVTYFGVSPDAALERCLDWERDSVAEWEAKPRSDADAITDFYRTTRSWCFDLLWYAYLQATGHAYPSSVDIVRSLQRDPAPGPTLDFGSGVGVTSQLLSMLGQPTTLADISATLLAFAHFRLERRGIATETIDLTERGLDAAAYTVVVAIDTLTHVPDLPATLRMLHRTLRAGGVLFTNLDVRKPSPETAWHLYSDEAPLRIELYRAGFHPVESLEWGMVRYRRVEPGLIGERFWRLGKGIQLHTPGARVLRRLQR